MTVLAPLTLANAVSLATEPAPGAAEHATRLMGIAIAGLGVSGHCPHE